MKMKNCPNCGNVLNDEAAFCNRCGTQFPQTTAPNMQYQPVYNMYDHTAEFDPKDVSENKVFCMVIYLMSMVGIIIAMLAQNQSPYIRFHVRQALKITVAEILLGFCCMLGIIPFLGWLIAIVAVIMLIVLFIVRITCFVNICNSRAVEPAIVRSLNFLK